MRNKSPKQIGDLPDELLINILSHVPSGHRMEIRPVSQKWNDIICDIRYHIDPVFICEESGLPYYSSTTPIRFNSVLSTDRKCDKGESQTPWPQLVCSDTFDKKKQAKLLQSRAEFITSPPISVLKLHVVAHTEDHLVSMTLRAATPVSKRPQGLRVGDLIDYFDMLGAYAQNMGWDWYGSASYRDWANFRQWPQSWEVVDEAKGKLGFEVRRRKAGLEYDSDDDDDSSDRD
jgi:hypothetical protein